MCVCVTRQNAFLVGHSQYSQKITAQTTALSEPWGEHYFLLLADWAYIISLNHIRSKSCFILIVLVWKLWKAWIEGAVSKSV